MDVAVTDLRAHLSTWLARVGDGEEVVVTDHGIPVARLVGIKSRTLLQRLTDEGIIGKPLSGQRPRAAGRVVPTVRRPVSDIVSEQRR